MSILGHEFKIFSTYEGLAKNILTDLAFLLSLSKL